MSDYEGSEGEVLVSVWICGDRFSGLGRGARIDTTWIFNDVSSGLEVGG